MKDRRKQYQKEAVQQYNIVEQYNIVTGSTTSWRKQHQKEAVQHRGAVQHRDRQYRNEECRTMTKQYYKTM